MSVPVCWRSPQEQLVLGTSHTNQSLLSLVPSTEKELSHSVGGQGWPGSGSIFWLYLGIHVCLGRGLTALPDHIDVLVIIVVINHCSQGNL